MCRTLHSPPHTLARWCPSSVRVIGPRPRYPLIVSASSMAERAGWWVALTVGASSMAERVLVGWWDALTGVSSDTVLCVMMRPEQEALASSDTVLCAMMRPEQEALASSDGLRAEGPVETHQGATMQTGRWWWLW